MNWVVIPAAAAVGALCRWGCVRAAVSLGASAPVGTLAVNVLGSFLAGVLALPLRQAHPLLGACVFLGFLGAFTTFSTYSLETAQMLLHGELLRPLVNLLLQNGLGLLAALGGLLLASACLR